MLLDGLQHRFLVDFGAIFGFFLRWFFWCFLNVVTTCTLTSFFKYFSMIFWLRRYSKILKIYCKTGVILNIRIFHSHDATIQNSIEKSLKRTAQKSMKIGPKTSSESNTLSGILFGAILAPFWLHADSILDPISFPKPFRIALGSSRDASRKWLWFRISFAGSAGGSWRDLAWRRRDLT